MSKQSEVMLSSQDEYGKTAASAEFGESPNTYLSVTCTA